MRFISVIELVFLVALALGGCRRAEPAVKAESRAEEPLIKLPETMLLSKEGYRLILDYEVGGGETYYQRYLSRPTWPGLESGVTVAVGYDLGYNARPVILRDWSVLPAADGERLGNVSGIRGAAAKRRVGELSDIQIAWGDAEEVFQRVSLVRFSQLAQRTYPGFDALHRNAQAALVSLTFNRGSSMVGERRSELREIRKCAATRDYAGMARWNRASIRIWKGTSVEIGMARRREAEARLMESGR